MNDEKTTMGKKLLQIKSKKRARMNITIRIALADILGHALGLELQATGGRAFLRSPGADFSRRWREAAFIPIVTPSVPQLKATLAAEATHTRLVRQ